MTTIEELDLDHAAATQGLMLLDHHAMERRDGGDGSKGVANPDLVPFSADGED